MRGQKDMTNNGGIAHGPSNPSVQPQVARSTPRVPQRTLIYSRQMCTSIKSGRRIQGLTCEILFHQRGPRSTCWEERRQAARSPWRTRIFAWLFGSLDLWKISNTNLELAIPPLRPSRCLEVCRVLRGWIYRGAAAKTSHDFVRRLLAARPTPNYCGRPNCAWNTHQTTIMTT